MYLEDYILTFAAHCWKLDSRPSEFLSSLGDQISQGRTLTTRQGHAAISVMKEIISSGCLTKNFPQLKKDDLKNALQEKRWKGELRVTKERRREARYLGDNIVALSFPGIPEMRSKVKNLGANWSKEFYLVSVKKSNFDALIEFLGVYGFDIDSTLEEYLAVCLESKDQISHVIAVQDGAAVNVCDDDLLAGFFLHLCNGERI